MFMIGIAGPVVKLIDLQLRQRQPRQLAAAAHRAPGAFLPAADDGEREALEKGLGELGIMSAAAARRQRLEAVPDANTKES
jgi:hypothetical protein